MFSLAFLAKTPVARAGAAEDAYAQAQVSYRELMAMPDEKKKFRHHWQTAIDKFKNVAEKYPKSTVADSALFTEGKLFYELYDVSRLKDDLRSAVTAWSACAEKYPKSHVADDSLFWEAKAQHVLGYHEKEAAALQALLEKYPKGDMAKDAKKALAKIEADGEAKIAVATPTAVAVIASPEATPTPKSTSAVVAPTPAIAVVGPEVTSGGVAGESQAIHKVKVISDAGYTRVVIYAGGEVHWEAHQIKADGDKPPRVYVDLINAHVGEDLKKDAPRLEKMWEIPIEDGLLKRARVAQNDGETVRVVLDLGAITKWRITPFDDPFRLIFDFYGTSGTLVAAAEPGASPGPTAVAGTTPEGGTPAPTATPDAGATPPLTPEQLARLKDAATKRGGLSLSEQLGLKVARIYIDAGHGGHDPGATGSTGVQEKDINLAIAQKLRKKLVDLGYDAVLTRKDDTFLELEERTGIANRDGDLFISVHCNSTDKKGDRNASGIEVYYADVASDKGSARLAAIENQTSPKHMSELQTILEGLARNEFTVKSAELATAVEKRLVDDVKKPYPDLKTHANGVKSALFYVCLTAHMPAILVETSFLSNPKEEKRLADPKYQQIIADSIANAADAWLDGQAMSGSRLAEKRQR